MANVGVRPTVDDSIKANLEVHLLIGEIGPVWPTHRGNFRHKLRDEKRSAHG